MYHVQSEHTIHADSYANGEGEEVNSFKNSGNIDAESISEAIAIYFAEVLYYNFDPSKASVDEDILYYTVLVDDDSDEVTQEDALYEFWKIGEAKLFSDSISIQLHKVVDPVFEEINLYPYRNLEE